VVTQVDPAQRLMLDDPGTGTVHADVAQATQQVQRRRQVFTQAVLYVCTTAGTVWTVVAETASLT
jgi:hypothetical protein